MSELQKCTDLAGSERSLQSQFYDLVLHLYEKSEIPSIFFVGFQNTLLRGETDSLDDNPYDLQCESRKTSWVLV